MASRQKARKETRDTEAREIKLTALTPRQAEYIASIKENDLTFSSGPAGTGKTYVASAMAADYLRLGKVQKVILCRPAVEAGEKLGYLPGDMGEKMAPWVLPFLDVIGERMGRGKMAMALKDGSIEVAPFSYMRGRSFKGAFIVLDEAQNTTREQMRLFLTRIGNGCKVIVDGDLKQSDISKTSGLEIAIDLAEKRGIECGIVKFMTEDIVRSELCRAWVEAFDA